MKFEKQILCCYFVMVFGIFKANGLKCYSCTYRSKNVGQSAEACKNSPNQDSLVDCSGVCIKQEIIFKNSTLQSNDISLHVIIRKCLAANASSLTCSMVFNGVPLRASNVTGTFCDTDKCN